MQKERPHTEIKVVMLTDTTLEKFLDRATQNALIVFGSQGLDLDTFKQLLIDTVLIAEEELIGATGLERGKITTRFIAEAIEPHDQKFPVVGKFFDLPFVDRIQLYFIGKAVDWAHTHLAAMGKIRSANVTPLGTIINTIDGEQYPDFDGSKLCDLCADGQCTKACERLELPLVESDKIEKGKKKEGEV